MPHNGLSQHMLYFPSSQLFHLPVSTCVNIEEAKHSLVLTYQLHCRPTLKPCGSKENSLACLHFLLKVLALARSFSNFLSLSLSHALLLLLSHSNYMDFPYKESRKNQPPMRTTTTTASKGQIFVIFSYAMLDVDVDCGVAAFSCCWRNLVCSDLKQRSSLSVVVVVAAVVVAATYFFVRYFIFARFSTKFCDWSR